MDAIQTLDLVKKYSPPRGVMRLMAKSPLRTEVLAVDKVSLTVKKGELFGLIGPNGAGKTTLIKILCTLLLPTSGKALVNDCDVVSSEEQVKALIGFVSTEARSFYWRLTGRENLHFFAALHNLKPDEAKNRVGAMLEKVGLDQDADNMVYTYSSGMKQKLAIARGLLTDPAILFLDEPTKGVDAITSRNIKSFIRGTLVEGEKRTVFYTSHRLEEVEELCDRLAIMDRGRIRFCGTVAGLKEIMNRKDRYAIGAQGLTTEELGEIAAVHGFSDISMTSEESDTVLSFEFSFSNGENPLWRVLDHISSLGGRVVSCDRCQPKLEEMFVEFLEEDP
jgi:ABC-2 type transport system ATP-binding protein